MRRKKNVNKNAKPRYLHKRSPVVLLFALTDHLGITASSLSVVEFLLVALQASGISTGIVPGHLWRDFLWFGLHPCILEEKNLDCLEPACLISLELLKLKIQLTCTASGLRILNRHSKGHQEIWKSHLIDHMVLSPHFFPCGNGSQCASKLTTEHHTSQNTLLVLLFQVNKGCHCSGMSNWGCKGGEVGGRTPTGCMHCIWNPTASKRWEGVLAFMEWFNEG